MPTPSPEDPFERRRVAVLNGLCMATIDEGVGDPIVFLHGNPTSSYLWRNIIPHVQALGRCIAPDLIGMGQSDKLPNSGPESYRFVEHRAFLDDLLAKLGVTERVVMVLHDWGSALGFDWARRHPEAIRGLCYMESIVAPMDDWGHFPAASRPFFQGLRSESGEDMVLAKNLFVERALPASVQRGLTQAEMEVYRRPYPDPESRRPTLSWPRQIPVGGKPADVVEITSAYSDWLKESSVPKLFINAEPGAILTGRARELCRTWPHQTEITLPGIHFIQEDSPDLIGRALDVWLRALPG